MPSSLAVACFYSRLYNRGFARHVVIRCFSLAVHQLNAPPVLNEKQRREAPQGVNCQTYQAPPEPDSGPSHALAKHIFQTAWANLLREYETNRLIFPRQVVWLNGAPGAGKGTMAKYIQAELGLGLDDVIVMSKILNSEEAQRLKGTPQLVSDTEAIQTLMRFLVQPRYRLGVLVDGFPRTKVQAEILKLLYMRLLDQRKEVFEKDEKSSPDSNSATTDQRALWHQMSRPQWRITVLYVDEDISVKRQLERGRQIKAQNDAIRRSGSDEPLLEERVTDFDPEKARDRFRIFYSQTLEALQSLREMFPYDIINARGTIDEVRVNMKAELEYQGKAELSEDTYDTIQIIPLASDIATHFRQDLVARLDFYQASYPDLFREISHVISTTIIPEIRKHTIAGYCRVKCIHPTLDKPLGPEMLVDILSERGFFVSHERYEQHVPVKIDLSTGDIITRTSRSHVFQIQYFRPYLRAHT